MCKATRQTVVLKSYDLRQVHPKIVDAEVKLHSSLPYHPNMVRYLSCFDEGEWWSGLFRR